MQGSLSPLLARVLLALCCLAGAAFAALPSDFLSKLEKIESSKDLSSIPDLDDFLAREQTFSAQDVAEMVRQLQGRRAAAPRAGSPLDLLLAAFKDFAHGELPELFPEVKFQWVRTRDWKYLSTITINPKPHDAEKPAVMVRTPYGPTTSHLADLYLLDGFVAVLQDQRGAFLSTGLWDFWRKDSQDAYDTMEWIAKQRWSNGRVYSAGISADGCSALTQPLFRPKWLKGQFIVWASGEAHATAYQGGAYRQSLINRWLTLLGITTRLHSWTVIDDVQEHEAKDGYWDTLSLRDNEAYGDITYPAVFYAGWYDIFQAQTINAFNDYQTLTDPSVRGKSLLYVDPGGHCIGAGKASFPDSFTFLPFKLSRDLFKAIETGVPHQNNHSIILYVMGTPFKESQAEADAGNYWTTLRDWPKRTPTPFYLSVGSALGTALPTSAGASSSYLYDPRDPVQGPGGNNLAPPCGVHDLSELDRRSDVLAFTSPVLTSPLAVVGPLQVVLYVSSDAVDTDFVAWLADVHPDNSSALVHDGVVRMRWRESNVQPVSMQEGLVYRITVELWHIAKVFNPNHRIRVYISSSNSPRFSVNRNNGKMVADGGSYVSAINTVHYSPEHPSHLLLPVVSLADIPENPEIARTYAMAPPEQPFEGYTLL